MTAFLAPGLVTRTIAARMVAAITTFFAITAVLFAAVELIPGDFASASVSRFTTADQIALSRERMGLTIPAIERYALWIGGAVRGDFGVSWYTGLEIGPLILGRLGETALLAAYAAVMAIPLGFACGVVSVVYRNSLFDRTASLIALAAISLPEFLVAYALMFCLAVTVPVFPVHTIFTDDMAITERLRNMTLPAATLAIVAVAPILRMTRASLMGVMGSPYLEMARLKGMGEWRVVLVHALPNAVAPIVNIVVLAIANFIVGAFVVEQIFSYPGIGTTMIAAVKYQDIPLALAVGIVFAAFFVSLNLLADIVAIVANPRIRYPAASARPVPFSRRAVDAIAGMTIRKVVLALAVLAALAAVWKFFLGGGKTPPTAMAIVAEPKGERDRLTLEDLSPGQEAAAEPVHYDYFLPVGAADDASEALSGVLNVEPFAMSGRYVAEPERSLFTATFPGFSAQVFTEAGVFLPVERDRVLDTESGEWQVILSAGRVWSEPGDNGWSRLSFPFTLVRRGRLGVSNGVAMFVYRGGAVSQMRVQIGQDGEPDRAKTDYWGQSAFQFEAGEIADREAEFRRHQSERMTDFPVKPWDALEDFAPPERLQGFDNPYIRRHVTVSGLLLDDTVYRNECHTRFGPYPYCDRLRHPVFSVSKSLGAGVAMLRLAEKYGPEVFDERILDHVPLAADHDGWLDVTFGDALNMATGIGNMTPERVSEYVETDFAPHELRIWRAHTTDEKLQAIAAYGNYPWGPGEVTRYKSSETFLLSAAMDRLIRARDGPDYGLWQMMTEEVFAPLGIPPIPTRIAPGVTDRDGIPRFESAMLPTYQEALKLARLIANLGEHDGKQILHRGMAARAIDGDMARGLPSGWHYDEGGEAHYDMSFWLAPYRAAKGCQTRVSLMVGYGGNYVVIMPNDTIGFRFADGLESVRATYDSAGIRRVSDDVWTFCE